MDKEKITTEAVELLCRLIATPRVSRDETAASDIMEQWMKEKHHFSELIGLIAAVGCLLIFGADNFMIPTMICILAALSFLKKPIESRFGDLS